MALDRNFFRKVMGQFATGVTIATTRSSEGIAGLTVNSFTSVSLDPLLVLICVDLRSQALSFFRAGGIFAVNILNSQQEALSNCFATSSEERYTHFCHADYQTAATGAPILDGSLAFIDARITAEYPGGDHAIFMGQIEAMGYEGQVLFLPGASKDLCTLPLVPDTANPISSNGHSAAEKTRQSPLLYYRGEYHHLSGHYHHEHPDLTTTPGTHEQQN
jgi:flavin reductase (DIM6/NTAB) family NADH-FMN oxidoreductase RutF